MIFKVLSNLNHNGIAYTAGSFITGEGATFDSLVADKILKIVEGAESVEDAKILDSEPTAETTAEETVVAKPADTWGPQPDIDPNPAPVDTEPKAETAQDEQKGDDSDKVEDSTSNKEPEAVSEEKTTEDTTGDNL